MSDQELIARLRSINKNYELARGVHVDIRQAADRIEALQKALKDQSSVSDRLSEKLYKAEGLLEQALRYNSAMHGGAGAYNKSIKDFLAELRGERHA